MTEREKIVEIIRQSGYGYFITHDNTDTEQALQDTAKALIENGIGDIAEWKARTEILERALRNSLFDLLSIGCMVIDLGGEKDLTEKYNLDLIGNMLYRIRQAEREIEEERK